MKCPSCGKELTSIKSIIRGRGYRCSCKRKEKDKEQMKLNFDGVEDGRAGKVRDSGKQSKDI